MRNVTGRRRPLAALTAAALLTACAGDVGSSPEGPGAEPTATASADPDVPPRWSGDGAAEGTVSFADGHALGEADDVVFTNGYEGTSTDDGAASTALVEDRLTDTEIIAGPARGLMGLGEGMGEEGATYDVSRALGRQGDGPWVLVTTRAFVALGRQQVITVSCPAGAGIDRTLGQLVQVMHASLLGLEKLP